MRNVAILALVGALLSAGCRPAEDRTNTGTEWPERPVRLVVPLGAGTAPDLVARLFAPRLAAEWGRPVVVENRSGADMIAGVAAFLAANDRHTLLFSPVAPVTFNPLVHDALPYEASDLTPISGAVDVTLVVAGSGGLAAASLEELVQRVRANPGRYHWAAGPGPPEHVFAAFLKAHGLQMKRVAYTEFAVAAQDFGEGRVELLVASLSTVAPHRQAGQARILAVLGASRSPAVPDAPTAEEAGYPELSLDGVFGVFGWRGMPIDLRRKIASAVGRAARDSTLAARLGAMGYTARSDTPEGFGALLERQRARLQAVAWTDPPRPAR